MNIITFGGSGSNSRFANSLILLRVMRDHNLLLTGYGLNSSAVYFVKVFGVAKDNSIFLSVLSSYGIGGWSDFGILCAGALIGLVRRSPTLLYLLNPFLVASTINSAEGYGTYKFALVRVLGILVQQAPSDAAKHISGRRPRRR